MSLKQLKLNNFNFFSNSSDLLLDNEYIQDSFNNDDSKNARNNLDTGGLTDIQFEVESQYGDGIATYMETKFNTTFSQGSSTNNRIKFDAIVKVTANRHLFLVNCLINMNMDFKRFIHYFY